MIVRTAEPADAAGVAAIYAHYVATSAVTFDESAPGSEATADKIASITSATLPFLVAEAQGRVVGYAYLSPYIGRSGYRHTVETSVYVASDARGRGVGRALLERLLAEGEQVGVREVIAIIAVTDDPASVALHRACGFVEAGRLEGVGFKQGRWHDTLLMQRSLPPRERA
ncbi:MAG: GNAT family N-acetyltransferase [Thermoleophilaceae bacterium]